jgi:hypothetical protein
MGARAVAVKNADIARLLSPVLAGEPDEAAARLLADPRLALDKRMSRGGYRGFELPPGCTRPPRGSRGWVTVR